MRSKSKSIAVILACASSLMASPLGTATGAHERKRLNPRWSSFTASKPNARKGISFTSVLRQRRLTQTRRQISPELRTSKGALFRAVRARLNALRATLRVMVTATTSWTSSAATRELYLSLVPPRSVTKAIRPKTTNVVSRWN